MVGIIIALVLRGMFILLGAAVIERFSWVFYLFGAFLVYTAINRRPEPRRGRGLRGEHVHPPAAPGAADDRGLRRHQAAHRARTARRSVTPMIIVFVAIGTTDLLFALDSHPSDLRPHPGAVHRLHREHLRADGAAPALLPARRAARAARLPVATAWRSSSRFIGVKLILEALHGTSCRSSTAANRIEAAPEIPIWLSLVVIVGVAGDRHRARACCGPAADARRDAASAAGATRRPRRSAPPTATSSPSRQTSPDPSGQPGEVVRRVAVEDDEVGPLARARGCPSSSATPSSSAAPSVVARQACAGVIPQPAISASSRRLSPCGPTPLSVPIAILDAGLDRPAERRRGATSMTIRAFVDHLRRERHARRRPRRARRAARPASAPARCRGRASARSPRRRGRCRARSSGCRRGPRP